MGQPQLPVCSIANVSNPHFWALDSKLLEDSMVAHEAAESRGAVADFLLGALRSSMGPGSDAEAPQEQQVPEGLQSEVVAEPPEDATSALFSLWDRLKSWGVFMTSQELFAIAHDVTPLELGSAASLADHTNQVFALARCSQTFPVGKT